MLLKTKVLHVVCVSLGSLLRRYRYDFIGRPGRFYRPINHLHEQCTKSKRVPVRPTIVVSFYEKLSKCKKKIRLSMSDILL